MTSKSELKRHVALGKPGALAEKLWYQHSHSGQMYKSDFLAAINEACAAVRARDASLCDELCEQETMSKHVNKENCRAARSAMDKCAAAISREELP